MWPTSDQKHLQIPNLCVLVGVTNTSWYNKQLKSMVASHNKCLFLMNVTESIVGGGVGRVLTDGSLGTWTLSTPCASCSLTNSFENLTSYRCHPLGRVRKKGEKRSKGRQTDYSCLDQTIKYLFPLHPIHENQSDYPHIQGRLRNENKLCAEDEKMGFMSI